MRPASGNARRRTADGSSARPGGSASGQAAAAGVASARAGRTRGPYCGPLDRVAHGVRHHPHRRHQPCRRRRRRRSESRNPGRWQVAGDHQPDRLEQHRSQALRPRRGARYHDVAAAAAGAFSWRRCHGQRDRRRDHPLGRGLEQHRVAARRRDRPGELGQGESHQHAAAPERPGEPAGDAAGALRRGQSPRADRAGQPASPSTGQTTAGASTTQQFRRADLDDERGQRIRFQRFPERVLLQPRRRLGGDRQGAAVEGLLPEPCRAEPDRLQRPGSQLPRRRRDSGSRSSRAPAPTAPSP